MGDGSSMNAWESPQMQRRVVALFLSNDLDGSSKIRLLGIKAPWDASSHLRRGPMWLFLASAQRQTHNVFFRAK
jgi:hypothetical protein